MKLNIVLNGRECEFEVDGNKRLVDFIRDDVGLTGTKEGCSEGECGACTVIYNTKAITSCTTFVGQVNGGEIITIEGIKKNGELDKLQKAFIENGAVQCGYCTPGMIMSAKALFMQNPHPTREEIITAIEGNLCRCTGYNQIVLAIEEASK